MHIPATLPLTGPLAGNLPNPSLSADAYISARVFIHRVSGSPVGDATDVLRDQVFASREATLFDSARFVGTSWSDLTDGGATTLHKHDHGNMDGLSDDDHPQYLLVTNIDDIPVNGELAQPISSNWAFDHLAAADPHPVYRLESMDHNHQSTGVEAGQLDHGLALTGLTDDDHTQYLLASAATDRATFTANWTDLTDGGSTTLHTHPATGVTNFHALIAAHVDAGI